jgi:hypothetical protein
MDVLLQGLGSIGFFAARAFLPAFMTALALRVGPGLPWLADSELLKSLPDAPTWFTAWPTIALLGLLAAAEMAASRSTDARALLDQFDHWLKPALAVLTYLGIASAADAGFIEGTLKKAGMGDWLPALGIGAATFWLGNLRGSLLELLSDSDEDDDAGVRGMISWAEDLWAAAGPILLVLFPLAMAALVGLATLVMYLMRKRAERREDASRTPCAQCGTPTYRCAVRCAQCGAAVAEPAAVGFFGTSLPTPAPDREAHPYRLVEKKRCSVCATRLKERDANQRCPACGHALLTDPAFVERYLAVVAGRVPQVLLVCLVCSLVPIAGLLPGVIYYRLALVAPFRRYIPRGRSLLMKWGMRLLFLALVSIQWIPAVGGVVVPIMALVNYFAWREMFLASIRPAQPTPAAAAT